MLPLTIFSGCAVEEAEVERREPAFFTKEGTTGVVLPPVDRSST